MGLFHITTPEAWAAAQVAGEYRPDSLEAEGFIHLSEDRQLMPTAERHYAGQEGLIVLALRRDRVRGEIRMEEAHGETFPHLYAPLNLDAVVQVVSLPLAEGRFRVPVELRPWGSLFWTPRRIQAGLIG